MEVVMKWRSVKLDPPQPYEFVWWGWFNDDESTVLGQYVVKEHGYPSCYKCEAVGVEDWWYADEYGRPAPTHWLPRLAPDFPTLDNIMLYEE